MYGNMAWIRGISSRGRSSSESVFAEGMRTGNIPKDIYRYNSRIVIFTCQ